MHKLNINYIYFFAIDVIIFLLLHTLSNVFASPLFEQEIIDDTSDWVNLDSREFVRTGDRYTDIVSVDYFSDGRFFNSTIWLLFPFKELPIRENINYGMYIDSDFDRKTGFGGIDYKIEIQWIRILKNGIK